MEIFWTVFTGVIVFVLSQLFVEFFLRPIQEYKKLKAKIAHVVTSEACYYSNPSSKKNHDNEEDWYKAFKSLRSTAAEVKAFVYIKPRFNHFIPEKEALNEIAGCLIGLSNSCYLPSNDAYMRRNIVIWERTVEYFLQNNKLPDKGEIS